MVVEAESIEELGLGGLPEGETNESILLSFKDDIKQGIFIESSVNIKGKIDKQTDPKILAQIWQEVSASKSEISEFTIAGKIGYKLEYKDTGIVDPYHVFLIFL